MDFYSMSVNGYTEKALHELNILGIIIMIRIFADFSVTIFYVHRVIVANIVTSGVVVTLP